MAKKKTAKKPEFKVPGATGTTKDTKDAKPAGERLGVAAEDSKPTEGTDEHEVAVDVAGGASPGSESQATESEATGVVFELELVAVRTERCSGMVRIDRRLSVPAAKGQARLHDSFDRHLPDERNARGTLLDRRYSGPYVERFLERLADPRVKRVVFLSQ